MRLELTGRHVTVTPTIRKLVEGGFASIEALAGATAEQLSEIPGIGEKTAEKILAAAKGGAESPADVPATGEPATGEPVTGEPAADAPATDEPVTDKPATE